MKRIHLDIGCVVYLVTTVFCWFFIPFRQSYHHRSEGTVRDGVFGSKLFVLWLLFVLFLGCVSCSMFRKAIFVGSCSAFREYLGLNAVFLAIGNTTCFVAILELSFHWDMSLGSWKFLSK